MTTSSTRSPLLQGSLPHLPSQISRSTHPPHRPGQPSNLAPSTRSLAPAYSPHPSELYPGPKNRLFLSLRSGIEGEIDWALPRLVLASHEQLETFNLAGWVDSVAALQYWPERWVEMLEREAAYDHLKSQHHGYEEVMKMGVVEDEVKYEKALGAIPEWTKDPKISLRASNSLQILRNASLSPNNANIIARQTFLSFLARFFSLPFDFILSLSLRDPEPIQHILVILNSIYPHLPTSEHISKVFSITLPRLLIETRDLALIQCLLPLLIVSQNMPGLSQPPENFISHLLRLLTLSPVRLLEMVLDLLISLTANTTHARTILTMSDFAQHLKVLTSLLEYAAKPYQVGFEPRQGTQGLLVRNPAGSAAQADEASKRRAMDREQAQKIMLTQGGKGVDVEVGDKPVILSNITKARLYAMREPIRSIQWMHEIFVYSSIAHLPQVTFWHAYREFFASPAAVEQMLSASEVIKNVTIAFPGASARVWTDATGSQKFVIAGIGFRKGSDEEDRFSCLWRSCPRLVHPTNPTQLFEHLISHLPSSSTSTSCEWATCSYSPCTISHLTTHLPIPSSTLIPEYLSIHPSDSNLTLASSKITDRPIPPPPKTHRLIFTAQVTPIDSRRLPTGVAFLTSLIIRNLARALRSDMLAASPDVQEEKRKHLQEERFGLPMPEFVAKLEEEEEAAEKREEDEMLNEKQRERAKRGFELVEGKIGDVIMGNMVGLGQYLSEAWGW
ncbi:hypothetical protein TREMEDRAFT_38872 [Tremella mesenterica DSM 1558]|uniref:uncharacterized protein n=1 Tax=Tremella mesenterica (strain ATCC 24925 / CBS 8224 / DSM 1558 / NBRC 9311 / NRRL Y-6157 / RJB 2259-6 / UBC 559-6) TaxID=578456 RepID=UPI0003F494C3|nr:uncharacterized protein TREMEDRAFT_38872 [Tremella mesenterica DSM 1558]EIW70248.1 hypothetical protein TREMEDRAFT_38872 [Tremella mesenterica DSM 1558]